jgi:hypothetical protein
MGLVVALGWCAVVAAVGLRRAAPAARCAVAAVALLVAGAMVARGMPYALGYGLSAVPDAYPDWYQTMPFYRGVTFTVVSAVVELTVVAALVLAVVAALVRRGTYPVVAVLLVTPAALLALNRGGYWTAELTRRDTWPALVVLVVTVALLAEWLPSLRRAVAGRPASALLRR